MARSPHEVVVPNVSVDSPVSNGTGSYPPPPVSPLSEPEDHPRNLDPTQMSKTELRSIEGDVLHGLFAASEDLAGTTATIDVERHGKIFFSFRIRPLSEREVERLREECTSYRRDSRTGLRLPEDVDTSKYRSMMLYTATIDEDRRNLWDNSLVRKKFNVFEGYEVIDEVLKPGEKDKSIEILNSISGYGESQEEARKSTDRGSNTR